MPSQNQIDLIGDRVGGIDVNSGETTAPSLENANLPLPRAGGRNSSGK
jgi:hypothetical protein